MPPLPVAGRPSRSAEAEGAVAGKVARQEVACCCEFVAHEAQSHQPSAHCEFGVFVLLGLGACATHILCHLAQCEAKLNVALELPCVEPVLLAVCRLVELEKAEFNRAFCEGGVQVEHMVAALIVVLASAKVASLCAVPDVCKLRHRGGLLLVEGFKEAWINRSAEAVHSALVDLDRLGDQAFVARHDVGEVPERLRCVSVGADVNVNPCADSCVADRSSLSQAADQLLQGFDVVVVQDRRYQFALFAVDARDADVLLELPLASLCVPSAVGFVTVPACCVFVSAGAEEVGGDLCSRAALDVVHLDLNADRLLLHSGDLLCCSLSHFRILRKVNFWLTVGRFPFR